MNSARSTPASLARHNFISHRALGLFAFAIQHDVKTRVLRFAKALELLPGRRGLVLLLLLLRRLQLSHPTERCHRLAESLRLPLRHHLERRLQLLQRHPGKLRKVLQETGAGKIMGDAKRLGVGFSRGLRGIEALFDGLGHLWMLQRFLEFWIEFTVRGGFRRRFLLGVPCRFGFRPGRIAVRIVRGILRDVVAAQPVQFIPEMRSGLLAGRVAFIDPRCRQIARLAPG